MNGLIKLSKLNTANVKVKTPLGIPNYVSHYLEVTPQQDAATELKNLDCLINTTIKNDKHFAGKSVNVEFINYGKTQLVFLATTDKGKQYTLMVNQPATKLGFGKNEFNNLRQLNQIAPNLVIKPMSHFEEDKHELYITPYYQHARCICVEKKDWGMWIPELGYCFKKFDSIERSTINSSMVAALVRLYDQDRQQGLANCRLDGGDFMLMKGFDNCELSYDNATKHLKLIAARQFVKLSLDDYIDQLRDELLGNLKKEDLLILGQKLKQPLTIQEINTGVAIGMSLREQVKNAIQEKTERGL